MRFAPSSPGAARSSRDENSPRLLFAASARPCLKQRRDTLPRRASKSVLFSPLLRLLIFHATAARLSLLPSSCLF